MGNAGRSLPSFPHLRYLCVTINAQDDSSEPGCDVLMPVVVPRLLAAIISRNTQPSLCVFNFAGRWLVRSKEQCSDKPTVISPERGWAEIDNILSNQTLFPKLRIVRCMSRPHRRDIRVYGTIPDETVQPHAREQTLTALEKTRERLNVLDVGVDRDTESCVNDLISTMIPVQFIPDTD